MITQDPYEQRRNEAVNRVVKQLCYKLFKIDTGINVETAHTLIQLMVQKAGGRNSEGGEALVAKIEELEKQLGSHEPYHNFFPQSFLAELCQVATTDVALYISGLYWFPFKKFDAIDFQYLIDILADGLDDPTLKRGPIERARTWAKLKLAEFDEIPSFAAPAAKGTTAADVRRYFPKAATIHGTAATDANALHQLAVWLLHWAERPDGKRYSLLGQLREQMAAHPDAGKFLKASRRLHEALTPLAATETAAKALLGKEHTAYSLNNLQAVLKSWASWIREQTAIHVDPAGAYLASLRSVPIVEEWEKGSPRYTLPIHLIGYDDFDAEIAPLRQAFEAALPDLAKGKKRALRHALNELLTIDREGVQRRREQFERGDYSLGFLPADYPALRFDVAGQPSRFQWQWVGPMFWGGLKTLLQYKQMEARTAFDKLSAALPDISRPAETPAASLPQTWDEFLPQFRRAVRLIKLEEFTEADCERLTQLGQQLVKELGDSIKRRPKATKLRLIEVLRECLNEMPHAETTLHHKLADLGKPPALYDARYPLIREAIAAAEDTLGGLIELLGNHYPETLAGHIRTTKGVLAVRELIVKYLPGWHNLNADIRSEKAAAAALALDTPAPASPRPELPGEQTPPPILFSSADLVLGPGFTLDDADGLARAVKLIDEAGNYCLGPRKLGAVVGFALALQQAGKLTGAIPALTAVLGPRWSVQVATRKTTTTVAQHYFSLTNKALARPKMTD